MRTRRPRGATQPTSTSAPTCRRCSSSNEVENGIFNEHCGHLYWRRDMKLQHIIQLQSLKKVVLEKRRKIVQNGTEKKLYMSEMLDIRH